MREEIRERRSFPRYIAKVPCSVLTISFDMSKPPEERRPATLGYTHDVSLQSISVVLPSGPAYDTGSSLGAMSEITLALPDGGYVRLDGTLLRHAEANEKENLFAFRVEGGSQVDRRLYTEYLDSLRGREIF